MEIHQYPKINSMSTWSLEIPSVAAPSRLKKIYSSFNE